MSCLLFMHGSVQGIIPALPDMSRAANRVRLHLPCTIISRRGHCLCLALLSHTAAAVSVSLCCLTPRPLSLPRSAVSHRSRSLSFALLSHAAAATSALLSPMSFEASSKAASSWASFSASSPASTTISGSMPILWISLPEGV